MIRLILLIAINMIQLTASAMAPRALYPSSPSSLKHPVAEGFYSEIGDFSPNLLEVWKNTWLLAFGPPENIRNFGSAFLLEAHPIGNTQSILVFATNQHVLETRCLRLKMCGDALLYREVGIAFSLSSNRGKIIRQGPDFFASPFSVLAVDARADVALVAAIVSQPEAHHLPRNYLAPLIEPGNKIHNEVYHMGFPAVGLESAPHPYDSSNLFVRKRWSRGILLDTRNRQGRIYHVATTGDGYPGQSGGPIVTKEGIVGINFAIFNDQRSWFFLEDSLDAIYWYTRYFEMSSAVTNYLWSFLGYPQSRSIPYMGTESGIDPKDFKPHFFGYSSTILKNVLEKTKQSESTISPPPF